MRFLKLVFIFLLFHPEINVSAHGEPDSSDEFYGVDEKTGSYLPEDIWFYNEDSVPVNLFELIDKPVLLSFSYFNCPDLCNRINGGIAELINKSEIKTGTNYEVITVSFDENETPTMARAEKDSVKHLLNDTSEISGWHYLTGTEENIRRITEAAGWKFRKLNNEIIHPAAVILITPHKKISQYLYGTFFMPVHFQMAVQEAWKENTSPPRIETLKYCYNYDKKVNRYSRSFTVVAGLIILASVFAFFITLMFKPIKR